MDSGARTRVSRRGFLSSALMAGAGLAVSRVDCQAGQLQARRTLRERFLDLSRHFIFEYYPWYGRDPYRHWDQSGHRPPTDLASNYVPKMGVYEYVYTESALQDFFAPYFEIHKLERSFKHMKDGRAFKRRTIAAYMQKPR